MFILFLLIGVFTYGTDIEIGPEWCNLTKIEYEGLSIDDCDMGI